MRGQLASNVAATAAALVSLAGFAGSAKAADTCGTTIGTDGDGLVTEISADVTWGDVAHPSPICLREPIFVKGGATLTILPGTIVRGDVRTAPPGTIDGSPGALVITQTGRIISDGSPTNPIIFTTMAVDNNLDGVCDDFDTATFGKDSYPGYDPAALPALVPSANPHWCDKDPAHKPMAPLDKAGKANVTLWGGVILLGNAPNNLANGFGHGYGIGEVEGLPLPGVPLADAVCGGVQVHDNTGVIRYTSVRHGGDEIGASNEINGFTLCGLGDGTVFEYNDVYANYDDCFEYFGGTVNTNHLVGTYCGDDYQDQDWGYTGTVQFVLSINTYFQQVGGGYGQAGGDRLGELDGDDYVESRATHDTNARCDTDFLGAGTCLPGNGEQRAWPFSTGFIYNYTGIGSTPNVLPPLPSGVVAAADNEGIMMRNGYAGSVANSLFVNTGSKACLVLDMTAGTGLPDTSASVAAGLNKLVATSCNHSAALAGGAITASSNGNTYALNETKLACSQNEIDTANFVGLTQEDPTFNPEGDANNQLTSSLGAPYNPRPSPANVGPAGIACGVTPQGGGLDRAATYRGAFPQTAPSLWTDGWATLAIAGLLK